MLCHWQQQYDLSVFIADAVLGQAEIDAFLDALRNDESLLWARRRFLDLGPVERIEVDFTAVRSLVDALAELAGSRRPGRLAALAPRPAAVGILRMYEALTNGAGLQVRPCGNLAQCAAFLDIPLDALLQARDAARGQGG
jgi:hypothetical protein